MEGNKRLNDEQLAEIRKRAEAATAGPWYLNGDLLVYGDGPYDYIWELETEKIKAEFIAHAREDVPKLLAEIERLESVNKALSTIINADVRINGNTDAIVEELFGDKIRDSAKRIADELRRRLNADD